MNNENYNGWTNYETWSVALLIDNDQGSQEHWHEEATDCFEFASTTSTMTKRENATYDLSERIKREHEENNPLADKSDIYSQLLQGAMSEVNWDEIAKSLIDGLQEQERVAS